MFKIIALFIAILVVVISAQECKFSSDCKPRECCHSLFAVPKDLAPNCTNTTCDKRCIDGAVDCNAKIGCAFGLCIVSKEYKFCERDSDCEKDQCCHAKDSVRWEFSPSCEGVACTLICEPHTLDCGQGKITCERNNCTAVLLDDFDF